MKNRNPISERFNERVPAMYLEDNRSELYKTFPFKDEISKSTFMKYSNISREFKKPHS